MFVCVSKQWAYADNCTDAVDQLLIRIYSLCQNVQTLYKLSWKLKPNSLGVDQLPVAMRGPEGVICFLKLSISDMGRSRLFKGQGFGFSFLDFLEPGFGFVIFKDFGFVVYQSFDFANNQPGFGFGFITKASASNFKRVKASASKIEKASAS